MLSVIRWRTVRQRVAPTVRRIAISFSRPAARASSKLATFAHATSNTKPTATRIHRSHAGDERPGLGHRGEIRRSDRERCFAAGLRGSIDVSRDYAKIGANLREWDSGFGPAHQHQPTGIALVEEGSLRFQSGVRRERDPEGGECGFRSVKSQPRCDTGDGESAPISAELFYRRWTDLHH